MHFDDESSDLAKEKDRLLNGRKFDPFDDELFNIVAALTLRLKDSRESLAREGSVIDDGKGFPVEHPALAIEKRASMELRGWVKDRPDLFGASGGGTAAAAPAKPTRRKFTGMKSV